MDQVRAVASVIWQQRFWVLSVLGLIVALVCWSLAASDLDAQFQQRNDKIEGAFKDMATLAQQPTHPNSAVNDEDQHQVEEQAQNVLQVWKDLYDRQRDVLTWPKELGAEFIKYIQDRKFRDPISLKMRTTYQNYIEKRFDGLLDIVKAQKLDTAGQYSSGARGGYGGEFGGRGGEYSRGYEGSYAQPGAFAEGNADDGHLVQWLDQGQLRAKLMFGEKPTATQIWVTQEDLWVYEALLKVIAKTNEARNATRPDNTAIRVIIALEDGQSASMLAIAPGNIYVPQSSTGGMGYGERGGEMMMGGEFGGEMGGYGRGEMDMSYGREYGPEMGMGRGMGGEDGASIDTALLTSRYLDDEGNPMEMSDSFGDEYRQLPIRMLLMMDQRWLPQLLIECANSPLPIEVKQVRVNPERALEGFATGGGSGFSGANLNLDLSDPWLAQVEVKGVIYIYKEPNEDLLGTPAAEDNQVAQAQ